ncbi:bacillithiol biosynthesis BshC [Peribacillus frigoritolerans]|nr:bacillithiol biosynthesis BshC [Peribacillus frigoritolerans]
MWSWKRKKAEKWLEEIIETYGETEFTNKLLIDMKETIKRSNTFVDFFAELIHEWFKEYGLLLVDAGDPDLRQIEKAYFESMVNESGRIAEVVEEQQSFMHAKGYAKMIEMEKRAANLFYYDPEKKRSMFTRTCRRRIQRKKTVRYHLPGMNSCR